VRNGWNGPPYLEAAAALAGGDVGPSPEAAQFLASLGYARDQLPPAEIDNRAGLLRFAARMGTLLPYRSPDAPGLLFFLGMFDARAIDGRDGEADPVSTIGAALEPGRAFEASVGEAVEYASQLQRGDETLALPGPDMLDGFTPAERSALAASLCLDDASPLATLSWLPARRLVSGTATILPADLCLRRPPSPDAARAAAPLSIGCAAAPTLEEAVLGGLLELVERDAAALWWHGGQPAAALPLDGAASLQASVLLREIRRGSDRRATWLLDVTTEIGIPCIAALSVDRDGRRIACGLAAALSPDLAACSAIREMCQYELGYHLIDVKRHANPNHELSEQEIEQLRRGAEILPDTQPLLHPALGPRRHAVAGELDAAEAVDWIVTRLQAAGFHARFANLTRAEFGIPVAKVVVPGLQLDPSDAITPRLREAMRRNGVAEGTTRLSLH
jgi:ribosomal protein S12 methylthiotransferase accessory factor